jgi:phosphoribosylglycinamide formyltransferase 1
MAGARKRVAVLVSGSGTNLQALIDAAKADRYPAEVALVISNVAGVRALERAAGAGVPTLVIPHGDYRERALFEQALLDALAAHRADIVCLAGFMRLLSRKFLADFPGPVLNIHPSLLPAFPGMHAVRQALDYGAKVTGCTVHFVDEGTDTGSVIAQAAVPVMDADDEAALAARIRAQEHWVYPLAVRLVAEGRAMMSGRRVWSGGGPRTEGLTLRNPG